MWNNFELRFVRRNRDNDHWELFKRLEMSYHTIRTLIQLYKEFDTENEIFYDTYGHFTKILLRNFSNRVTLNPNNFFP